MREPSMSPVQTEFLRYLVVGGLAFSADFTALATLTSMLGMHYLLATLFAFLLGTWVNYQLSIRWVFRYRSVHQQGVEFTIFLMVGVITLGLSLGMMELLVAQMGLYYLLAKCVTTGFTLVANFTLRRVLLFSLWPMRLLRVLGNNKNHE